MNTTKPIEEEKVVCTMCENVMYEDDLELLKDGEEYYKGCPKCKTDAYLKEAD
jgi:hypothetical protein